MEMEQKLDQLKDEIYRTVEENKGLKKVIYFQLLNYRNENCPLSYSHNDYVTMIRYFLNQMWLVKECYLLC